MKHNLNIMVVDNEKLVAKSIVDMLKMYGHKASEYLSAKSALETLHTKKQIFDVILTDINMPIMDGYSFIEKVKSDGFNDIKIIVLTGYGSIDSAVKAIKLGASSYFEKDSDPELLLFEIDKIAENIFLQKKMISLEQKMSSMVDDFYMFTSQNEYVRNVFKLAKQVAPKDVNILITGESGTGKEILSRYIHQNSARKKKRFTSINCSAISDSIFESEIFGHVKGSFTGAIKNKKSFFEQAQGGTLLLDEIGEMTLMNQVKLLKVLEDKLYYPVGGTETKPVDCRIISATNQELQKRIDNGDFRKDLYFRINTVELNLPPLKERKEDILGLVEMFIKFFNKKYQKNIIEVTEDAKRYLLGYNWPGNIRELRQVIERCVIFSEHTKINKKLLLMQEIMKNEMTESRQLPDLLKPYKDAKSDFDRLYFVNALKKTDGNITELAKISGINRTHIYKKLKTLNLELH